MAVANNAFEALDIRLRRLEYVLTGSTATSTDQVSEKQSQSIPNQIQSVNEALTRIANQNKNIKKILQFCDSEPSILEDKSKHGGKTLSLSQPEKQAVVLSSAPLYHQVSSQLLAIRDLPFPSESVSAEIANSLPEVVKVQLALTEKNDEIMELTQRSLSALEGWYQLVEGFNACVAEWDDRLRELEIKLCRREKQERDSEEY